MVKVLFGNLPTGYLMYGGAEVQLEHTRGALERLGVNVRLFSQWDRATFDGIKILHWFHIDPSSLEIFRIARQRGLKIIVSAIFWPRRPRLEPLWARIVRIPKKLGIPLTSYFGIARETLGLADIVIASSESEAFHLHKIFAVPKEKLRIVHVGVSTDFASASPELFRQRYGLSDFVLCVGRIEPRKNQLRLIAALRDKKIPIVLIGDYSINHEYYCRCLEMGGQQIRFLGCIDHQDPLLSSAYASAKVLAMPSTLETPGLVALEGALAGCRLAVTSIGNTHEYYQDYVEYVNPWSVSSIRKGVLKAMEIPKERVSALKELILREYSWDTVGSKIISIYAELLGEF